MTQSAGRNATWKVLPQLWRRQRWLRPRFGTNEQRSKQILAELEAGRNNRDSCELDMEREIKDDFRVCSHNNPGGTASSQGDKV